MIKSEKFKALLATIGMEILKPLGFDPLVDHIEPDELWAVLSALRGPDNGVGMLKHSTTTVIRYAMLSYSVRGMQQEHFINHPRIFDVSPDDADKAKFRANINLDSSDANHHFIVHATHAFIVLGLDWHSVNDIKLANAVDTQTQDLYNTSQVPLNPL